jgi:peroxiredoxin
MVGLVPGDHVDDFALPDDQGRTWRLTDHWGYPVVLVFHRHLMCLPCQEHLREIRDRVGELDSAAVAVVTFARRDRLPAFRTNLDLPFPVLADESRDLYAHFGLDRAPWRRIYNLSTLRLYGRLLRRGRRFRRPREDTRQLGGDFVVGPDRRLVYAARPPTPDARPPVEDLVAAVHRCLR